MEKFDKLLSQLNEFKRFQLHLDVEECIPAKIYDEHFKDNDYEFVEVGLFKDKRRWYSTSVSVIDIYGRYLGIRHVDTIFSELTACEDLYYHLEFMEMEEVKSVTYRQK